MKDAAMKNGNEETVSSLIEKYFKAKTTLGNFNFLDTFLGKFYKEDLKKTIFLFQKLNCSEQLKAKRKADKERLDRKKDLIDSKNNQKRDDNHENTGKPADNGDQKSDQKKGKVECWTVRNLQACTSKEIFLKENKSIQCLSNRG